MTMATTRSRMISMGDDKEVTELGPGERAQLV
jgi:hypothetical protein